MLTVNDPPFDSDEDSMDSFNQLVDGDEYNVFDVEPYIQADHNGLACDAARY